MVRHGMIGASHSTRIQVKEPQPSRDNKEWQIGSKVRNHRDHFFLKSTMGQVARADHSAPCRCSGTWPEWGLLHSPVSPLIIFQ